MTNPLACYIRFPNPDNHTGPDEEEIYLNAREGLLRVLDLVTGNVTDEHLKMDNRGLEEEIEEAQLMDSEGLVQWTFVQIMDLNVP
jgi:hypothetical protein